MRFWCFDYSGAADVRLRFFLFFFPEQSNVSLKVGSDGRFLPLEMTISPNTTYGESPSAAQHPVVPIKAPQRLSVDFGSAMQTVVRKQNVSCLS